VLFVRGRVLVSPGEFKQIGVLFAQALPLADLLVEAEVAAGAGTPAIVVGEAEAGFLQDGFDLDEADVVVLEGVDGDDVGAFGEFGGPLGDVAVAVLVAADADVAAGVVPVALYRGGVWTRYCPCLRRIPPPEPLQIHERRCRRRTFRRARF
jgi:hypothetical protein